MPELTLYTIIFTGHHTSTLQFTGTDDVVLQIPAMAWEAFAVCAARRKVDPASHLAGLVGRSIENGITVAEIVEWLRP
jgi:hypothetical protein